MALTKFLQSGVAVRANRCFRPNVFLAFGAARSAVHECRGKQPCWSKNQTENKSAEGILFFRTKVGTEKRHR